VPGLGEAVKSASSKASHINIEGPTRLLIAEDTISVQEILKRQLQKVGVEADFVENGRQALEALETGKYGILVTDLHMPGIDGYGLGRCDTKERKNGWRTFSGDRPDRRRADGAARCVFAARVR
jgi:PleD family two-component response regulator